MPVILSIRRSVGSSVHPQKGVFSTVDGGRGGKGLVMGRGRWKMWQGRRREGGHGGGHGVMVMGLWEDHRG